MIDLSFLSPMSMGGGMGFQPMQMPQAQPSRFGSVANLFSGGAVGTRPGTVPGQGGGLFGAAQRYGLFDRPQDPSFVGPQQPQPSQTAPGQGLLGALRSSGALDYGRGLLRF